MRTETGRERGHLWGGGERERARAYLGHTESWVGEFFYLAVYTWYTRQVSGDDGRNC